MYTQSHVDYVVEVFQYIVKIKDQICGVKIVESPPVLRHFTAKFLPAHESGKLILTEDENEETSVSNNTAQTRDSRPWFRPRQRLSRFLSEWANDSFDSTK